MTFVLRSAGASDTGTHRAHNEDAAFSSATAAAVADGVGGGPAGELASAALLHRLASVGRGPTSVDLVRVRVRLSNWDLAWLTRRDPDVAGMATTLTAVFSTGTSLVLAHVGDSRAYRLRDGVLTRMTRDDSYVQALVDAGLIDAAAAGTHPQRNIVTASLGGDAADGDAVTVTELDVLEGDRWLLCSDGVSDYLPEELLGQLLLADSAPRETATALIQTALLAGSTDNVTAVVCDVVRGEAGEPTMEFLGAAEQYAHQELDSA